ncbi:MAG: carboxylesterase family protein [Clostridium sp.]|nr:carboxylesterase family protein [Clostridium sp.]MBP3216204.1 carboxylesterase family protein [Clostridium sp.]
MNEVEKSRERMKALYGKNHKITDGQYDKSLAVKCINGTFVGKRYDNVIAYRGIPFVGHQPVGEYRWKAPSDFAPDDGVYEAYYFGTVPFQNEDHLQIGSMYPQSEECLYLNVWRADDGSTEKKPVIVWIHGGAFEVGSTAEPREEGTSYVGENPDIVFASIEYRLGVYGFLHLSHLPDGGDYPDAQNLGIMDQMMALRWIHENIEKFGGDPDNVTIIGESAGGCSVCLLPLVKGSHQYFHRVIAQSGTPFCTRTPEEAIACTDELMEIVGCKTVADLQKVDSRKLVEASSVLALRVFAERDGNYLPVNPYDEYKNGAAKDIAILQGCNKDEGGYFAYTIGPEAYGPFAADRKAKKLAQLTQEEKMLAEDFCSDEKNNSPDYPGVTRLFEQIMFKAPLLRMSENQTMGGGKSYTYYFTPESSIPKMWCAHTIEISTVFNHPEETLITGRRFDETFSKTLRRMWIQFAKTGNPSLSADISPDGKAHEWPAYDLKDKKVMVFDEYNIHPAKESEVKIVDWDRTYFLTKYYCI